MRRINYTNKWELNKVKSRHVFINNDIPFWLLTLCLSLIGGLGGVVISYTIHYLGKKSFVVDEYIYNIVFN